MVRNYAGFTLVEVLVAMVIFAISSLAVTSLMVQSSSLIVENDLASQAIALAQEQLENLREKPYEDITSGSLPQPVQASQGSTEFAVSWAVIENNGTKKIRTLVAWNYKGAAKQYETETIFTQVTRS